MNVSVSMPILLYQTYDILAMALYGHICTTEPYAKKKCDTIVLLSVLSKNPSRGPLGYHTSFFKLCYWILLEDPPLIMNKY